jgi:hypothetical protein
VRVVPGLVPGGGGWALANRSYAGAALREAHMPNGVRPVVPAWMKAYERRREIGPLPTWLAGLRRRVAPVLGSSAERFHVKCVGRGRWHLTARCTSKLLRQTVALLLTEAAGLPPAHLRKGFDHLRPARDVTYERSGNRRTRALCALAGAVEVAVTGGAVNRCCVDTYVT